jgi:acid phosphatase
MTARLACGEPASVAARIGRVALLLAAVLLVGVSFPTDRDRVTATAHASLRVARITGSVPGAVPRFGHAVVVVFENHSARRILDHAGSPFRWLAHRYALLRRYDAVAHPSLPNYLALVSGSTQGVHHDCTRCAFPGPSLADTLAARGLSWRTYAEHLPLYLRLGVGITGPEKARLPFLYFPAAHTPRSTAPLTAFFRDLRARRLPSFSLVIPDLCHDMHSCSVETGDAWLKRFLPPLLKLPRTAVFVVFDESDSADPGIPALALGPLVRPGSRYGGAMSHYALLRTIEDGLGLPRLGLSARAAPVTGIWRGPPAPGKQGSAAGH